MDTECCLLHLREEGLPLPVVVGNEENVVVATMMWCQL